MNQSTATAQIKEIIERNFFNVSKWLTDVLCIPRSFVRPPSYPGFDVIVNDQRMLVIKMLSEPLITENGNFANISVSSEAAAFLPYGNKGPSFTVNTNSLELEAQHAHLDAAALLEILVLHEVVHACMMGGIAQKYDQHAWIVNPDYRFIHEAVALKTCQFGIVEMLTLATKEDIDKYLTHVKSSANDRAAGIYYLPYFSTYCNTPLPEFWAQLRAIQPYQEIFDEIERLT